MKQKKRGGVLQDSTNKDAFKGEAMSESQGPSLQRLQVYLSHSGVASRRECEKVIASGRVAVNGVVINEVGKKVGAGDVVTLDGKVVKKERVFRYVLLNKPAGYLCAVKDDRGRQCAVDLVQGDFKERLYNVGRLDMESEGLLIFTNDGDFAKRVSHPSSNIEKEYIVDTYKILPRTLCEDFIKGVRTEDGFYRCKNAKELDKRKIDVILIEGKNREIRHVFKHYGVAIKRLTRVRIGNIAIGDLPLGSYRHLTKKEVAALLRDNN